MWQEILAPQICERLNIFFFVSFIQILVLAAYTGLKYVTCAGFSVVADIKHVVFILFLFFKSFVNSLLVRVKFKYSKCLAVILILQDR